MYVCAVHIEHFRCFEDAWVFPNQGLNLLLGPNNSGKSTILQAIGLVLDPNTGWYRDDVIGQFDFFRGDTSRPIQVRLWLRAHPDEPESSKVKFYDRLSKWSIKSSKRGRTLESLIVDPVGGDLPPHEELLALELTAKWNEAVQLAEAAVNIVDESGNPTPFSIDQKRQLGFRLVPATRSLDQQMSFGRRSLLSRSLEDGSLDTALRDIRRKLESIKSDVTGAEGVVSLLSWLGRLVPGGFLKDASGHLLEEFTLTFLGASISDLRSATSLATSIKNDGDSTSLALPWNLEGTGVQSLLLLRAIIESAKSSTVRPITAIEEPEQHLGPSLARWLFAGLFPAMKSKPEDPEVNTEEPTLSQLFVTTHSAALVAELRGIDPVLLLPTRSVKGDGKAVVLTASALPTSTKKSFERYREEYSKALLAKASSW